MKPTMEADDIERLEEIRGEIAERVDDAKSRLRFAASGD